MGEPVEYEPTSTRSTGSDDIVTTTKVYYIFAQIVWREYRQSEASAHGRGGRHSFRCEVEEVDDESSSLSLSLG